MRNNLSKKINRSGFTLVEMLATVIIMSLVTIAIASGVTVIRNNLKKMQDKSNAQVLLNTTVTEITNLCNFASGVATTEDSTSNPIIHNGNNSEWVELSSDAEGVKIQRYRASKSSTTSVTLAKKTDSARLLVSDKAAVGLVVVFDSYEYDNAAKCFTFHNMKVYEASDYANDASAALVLAELPEDYSISVLNGELSSVTATISN